MTPRVHLGPDCPWPVNGPDDIRISHSQTQTYHTCPFLWAVTKLVPNFKPFYSPAAWIGVVAHAFAADCTRVALAKGQSWVDENWEKILAEVFERYPTDPEIRAEVRELAQGFVAQHGFKDNGRVHYIEETFWVLVDENASPKVTVQLRPDYAAYDKAASSAGVVDYKFGEQVLDRAALDNNSQGLTYLIPMLLQHNPARMTYQFSYPRLNIEMHREATAEQVMARLAEYQTDGAAMHYILRGILDHGLNRDGTLPIAQFAPARPGEACCRGKNGLCSAVFLCPFAKADGIQPPTTDAEAVKLGESIIYGEARLKADRAVLKGYVADRELPVNDRVAKLWQKHKRLWNIEAVLAELADRGRTPGTEKGLTVDGRSPMAKELLGYQSQAVELLKDEAAVTALSDDERKRIERQAGLCETTVAYEFKIRKPSKEEET